MTTFTHNLNNSLPFNLGLISSSSGIGGISSSPSSGIGGISSLSSLSRNLGIDLGLLS
jgi:hypothetical protein